MLFIVPDFYTDIIMFLNKKLVTILIHFNIILVIKIKQTRFTLYHSVGQKRGKPLPAHPLPVLAVFMERVEWECMAVRMTAAS